MTVDGLIEHLTYLRQHGLSGSAIIKTYNADTKDLLPVSGFIYDDNEVEICTDDMQDQ